MMSRNFLRHSLCYAGALSVALALQPPAAHRESFGRRALDPVSYHAVFCDRVLMIRDPAALAALSHDPSQGATGSLGRVASLRTLLTLAGIRDFDADATGWTLASGYHSMRVHWPPCASGVRCLDTAPFRLLAISFRPDKADFRCGQPAEGEDACGAQVNFEFGSVPHDSGSFKAGLIVEFAAPRMSKADFQALLHDWMELIRFGDPAELAARFGKRWLRWQPRFSKAFVRLAFLGQTGATVWLFRQYEVDSGGLVVSRLLPGEIHRGRWWGLGGKLTPEAGGFLQRFVPGQTPLDEYFLKPAAEFALPVPPLQVFPPAGSWEQRQALVGNACSGCHSRVETGTEFLHITNRAPGERSLLSPFLRGSAGDGEPTLDWFGMDDPEFSHQGARREYNDLLRRRRFMEAVLSLSSPDRNWTPPLASQRLTINSVH